MSIEQMMNAEHDEPTNTPDSSCPSSSDSEDGAFSESEAILPSVTEPDVSLDEMLSLACRQGKLDIVQLLLQSGAHVNHRNKAGNTPLLEACSQGHVSVANYLLENGSKIDAPTESTLDSALTWACTLGNGNIVDALLYKKANVEHRTKDGCTALMFACLAGHRDVAEKLLNSRSEINVESDSNKDSPLTFACWKGHYDVVTLLLERNANIEHRTKEGFSPLMFAALGGHTKVARKLLETGAQVNVPSGSNNDIPLTSACWKGHEDVVKLLLEFNSCIEHRTKDGCTPLMLAAREGHLKVADLLLKNNSEVNVPSGSENNIPLTLACWKGHWEVVQLLLNYNSDIEHRNKAGCTPLMLAAREGHYETTVLLLERNARVNVPSGSNDDTPLTLACWKGHKGVVMLLLDSKSNIDHQTKTGCTPLMEATREGHRDVAEILLDHNADVELPDNYGQSPLFMACWKGHESVAELLLQKGAYRDCRTKTGITPLFQACRENHVAIVELLLNHGAGVNNPFPNSRENPLTLCAEKGHKKLVELLLLKGASLDCRTKKGCTPEFLACKEGHVDIAHMLAESGANLETPDCRGNTPIMAAYKNGHVAIVSWLIKSVHHLPSDELCHKILMSSVDDKDKEVIVQQRSKCLAIIQETKRKRELLALKNAQNLVQELDDEKNREEKKKKKKAAKRRDKNNKRKKNRGNEKELGTKLTNLDADGEEDDDDDDDNDDNDDEEENKDSLLPTENREDCMDDKTDIETLPSDLSSRLTVHDKTIDMASTKSSSRKKNRKKSERSKKNSTHESTGSLEGKILINDEKSSLDAQQLLNDLPTKTYAETTPIITTTSVLSRNTDPAPGASSHLKPIHQKDPCRVISTSYRTSGACTRESSTSGSCRSLQVVQLGHSTVGTSNKSDHTSRSDKALRVISNSHNDDIGDTPENDAEVSYCRSDSNSSVSRNSSFEEFKESDWNEVSRSSKLAVFQLVVPNSYCGRVIGKGGKKINFITEESGGQITIDKPPSNIIPAERIILIKGQPQCAEKARLLVTRALNTPSLNLAESPLSMPLKQSQIPVVESQHNTKKLVMSTTTNLKKPPRSSSSPSAVLAVRPAAADVVVTPVLSYSKVATGTVSLEAVGKQLKSQQISAPNSPGQFDTASSVQCSSAREQRMQSRDKETHTTSMKPDSFGLKDFSYFTTTDSSKFVNDHNNDNSARLDSQRNSAINSFACNGNTGHTTALDRGRSISWAGQPKCDGVLAIDGPGNRSMSNEAISDRQRTVESPWAILQQQEHVLSAEELSDGQVFEGVMWPAKSSVERGLVNGTEVWELSSSPTSSVSSSKVELTNILDNDIGLSNAHPLGPTQPSVHSESRISFHDQHYLHTPVECNTWLQSRGAYSAPSSPALQRNAENKTRPRSPKSNSIRSHPSMDELNNSRPWKNISYSDTQTWPDHPSSEAQFRLNNEKTGARRESNRDSGLSSPHSLTEKRKLSTDAESVLAAPTQWSVERFQHVRTLHDLLEHLSLDKYTENLEENSVTLESLFTLNEQDLQTFGLPKGPRLKILKACDILHSQLYSVLHPHQQQHEQQPVVSSQTFFPVVPQPHHTQQLHHLAPMDAYNKEAPFPPPYGYTDLLTYNVRHPPYSVVVPNNQSFVHNIQSQIHLPVHQHYPTVSTVYTSGQDFTSVQHHLTNHNGGGIVPPQYVYPDNQRFYFYPPS